jgi:outer membrane protein assembly factor BamD (BamD/ComL family)
MSEPFMQLRGMRRRWRRLDGRARVSVLLCLLLFITAAAATVIGCGWSGTEHSVRFNGFQTEREMGRLLPLPTLANGKTELRENWESEENESGAGVDENPLRSAETDAVWQKAEAAEAGGDLKLTRTLLTDYVARTRVGRDAWPQPINRQARRNSAIDRLDAMTALEHGTRHGSVRAYLAARRVYDLSDVFDDDAQDEVQRALASVPGEESLRDNVAYLRAALHYWHEDYSEAAAAFENLARQYPQSEKREAALYMAALATMKMSHSYTATSGDEAHLRAGQSDHSDSGEAVADGEAEATTLAERCDEAWREARSRFKALLGKYPRGRYAADARGWLAYLSLRADDRAGALVEYYRLLGLREDRNARLEAAVSLTLVRHHATESEMQRVEAELQDEPAAALAYAYHNIYNYAINPGCQANYDYPQSDWEAKIKEAQLDELQRTELKRVAAFASRLIERYPQASISGGFAVRLAGANLELGENHLAAQQAARALFLNVSGEERARALWLKGVAEHRLHHFESARRTLSILVDENPHGEFTEGARRLLAMVAEDRGDMEAALEQYLDLEYDLDVAYLVDVLMPPEQLESFIESHPQAKQRDELLYALGLRYMRARLWAEARNAFARVQTNVPPDAEVYNEASPGCDRVTGYTYGCIDPKERDTGPGVTARLLLYDRQTIDDLEQLEFEAAAARGDEAQAEALYQLASYQYQSSTLLFYNPLLWKGGRYWNLSSLEGRGSYRSPDEAAILWRYMQEHEPVARALVVYLYIARTFPQTRAARDALYTAAVCHERLSNYNEYWRGMYAAGMHAGDRFVTYGDVQIRYPDYQLPRGTYGWEPRTRTVNGGEGWAQPPRPEPRPTRRQYLQRLIERLWDWLGNLWEEKLRRRLVAGLALLGALYASSYAALARRLLRRGCERRRIQRRPLRLWLRAYRAGQLKETLGEEAQAFLRLMKHQALRLVLDRRRRFLLALNLLAHTLLLALLVVAVRMISSG